MKRIWNITGIKQIFLSLSEKASHPANIEEKEDVKLTFNQQNIL
jgi:hypothetical protein